MRMNRLFIPFFILLLALAGCRVPLDKELVVRRIVDGDTVELYNGKMVRYLGVDTPETRKRAGDRWVYSPEPYAIEAMDYNRKLVLNKKLDLEFDVRETDRYGRWLAYVRVGEVLVNERLLREGLAWYVEYPPNGREYRERFLSAQQEARDNSRGIWKDLHAISPHEAGKHSGEFCGVKGRVVNTASHPGVVYLYFGEKGEGALTAVIHADNLESFVKQDISAARSYRGSEVELFGKITDGRYGPEVTLYHPSQIKIIE